MAFILVTIFIDVLGIGIIIPILPELVKDFVGGSTASAGRWFGIIAATYAATQFFFDTTVLGSLSDRFGRRPIILISLFGFGVDYVIQGMAPSIGWLFVGRVIAGIMGASFTTANAYIADVSGPEDRARNFGLMRLCLAHFWPRFHLRPCAGRVFGRDSPQAAVFRFRRAGPDQLALRLFCAARIPAV